MRFRTATIANDILGGHLRLVTSMIGQLLRMLRMMPVEGVQAMSRPVTLWRAGLTGTHQKTKAALSLRFGSVSQPGLAG